MYRVSESKYFPTSLVVIGFDGFAKTHKKSTYHLSCQMIGAKSELCLLVNFDDDHRSLNPDEEFLDTRESYSLRLKLYCDNNGFTKVVIKVNQVSD